MNKTELLRAIRSARVEWEALLATTDRTQMEIAGVEGEWTLKDVIAHVTWYESEMVGVIRTRALVGSPHWNLPSQDERNAAIFADLRGLPLTTVLSQSQEVHHQLVEAINGLSDEELNDAGKFRDMPGEWLPWQVIASNTCEHYSQHFPLVRAWLDRAKPS